MGTARIGLALAVALSGCAETPTGSGTATTVQDGIWGGDHVALTVDSMKGFIEFDCAHGTLPVPIALDRGEFDVTGVFVQEHGGPIREDEPLLQQPMRYTGAISGQSMTLRVRSVDGRQSFGDFALTLGSRGRLLKCL